MVIYIQQSVVVAFWLSHLHLHYLFHTVFYNKSKTFMTCQVASIGFSNNQDYFSDLMVIQGSGGSGDSAVVRALASHQCCPGLIPGSSIMWAEFVVGSHPCSEAFSPGSLVLLPPQKPTLKIAVRSGNTG